MRMKKQGEEALNLFKQILRERLGVEIVSVHLFGSKARGDAYPESDIDVLVVTRHDNWKLKEQIGKAASQILLDYGVYLSVKVLGQSLHRKLIRLDSPFIRNVMPEGVLL